MNVIIGIDMISAILLINAFYMLWREKKHFYSIKPLLPAVSFLCVGHICDIIVERSSASSFHIAGLSPQSSMLLVALIGNICDVVGISLLVYGFVRIIKSNNESRKQIQDMETLLPICCNCKKYRAEDDEWLPIEQFLSEKGAPTSHGICPECYTFLYGDDLE